MRESYINNLNNLQVELIKKDIQFSGEMFNSSKFKHFQKSSWALAMCHCLQVAPALQRSL